MRHLRRPSPQAPWFNCFKPCLLLPHRNENKGIDFLIFWCDQFVLGLMLGPGRESLLHKAQKVNVNWYEDCQWSHHQENVRCENDEDAERLSLLTFSADLHCFPTHRNAACCLQEPCRNSSGNTTNYSCKWITSGRGNDFQIHLNNDITAHCLQVNTRSPNLHDPSHKESLFSVFHL